jgi:hypothetical protein
MKTVDEREGSHVRVEFEIDLHSHLLYMHILAFELHK